MVVKSFSPSLHGSHLLALLAFLYCTPLLYALPTLGLSDVSLTRNNSFAAEHLHRQQMKAARQLMYYARAKTPDQANTYKRGSICSAYSVGTQKRKGVNLRVGDEYSNCGGNGLMYNSNTNPTALVPGFEQTYDVECDHVLELQTLLPWIFDTLTKTGFNTFCQQLVTDLQGGAITPSTLGGRVRAAVNQPVNLHSIPSDVNQVKQNYWQGNSVRSLNYDFGRATLQSYIQLIRPAVDTIVETVTDGLESAYPGHGLNEAAAVASLKSQFNSKLNLIQTSVTAANAANPPQPICQPSQSTSLSTDAGPTAVIPSRRSLAVTTVEPRRLESKVHRPSNRDINPASPQDTVNNTLERRKPASYWAEFCDDDGNNCSTAFDVWNTGCFTADGTTIEFHGDPFGALYNNGKVTLVVSPDGDCPCQSSSQEFNIFSADTNSPYTLDKTGKSYRFVANSDTGDNCPTSKPTTTSAKPTSTSSTSTSSTTSSSTSTSRTSTSTSSTNTSTSTVTSSSSSSTSSQQTSTSRTSTSAASPSSTADLQTAPDPGEAADDEVPPEAQFVCVLPSSSSSSSSSTSTSTSTRSESSPDSTNTADNGDGGGGGGVNLPPVSLPGGFNMPGFHLPTIPGPGGIVVNDPSGHQGTIFPVPSASRSSYVIESDGQSSTVGASPTSTPEPTLTSFVSTQANGQQTTILSVGLSSTPMLTTAQSTTTGQAITSSLGSNPTVTTNSMSETVSLSGGSDASTSVTTNSAGQITSTLSSGSGSTPTVTTNSDGQTITLSSSSGSTPNVTTDSAGQTVKTNSAGQIVTLPSPDSSPTQPAPTPIVTTNSMGQKTTITSVVNTNSVGQTATMSYPATTPTTPNTGGTSTVNTSGDTPNVTTNAVGQAFTINTPSTSPGSNPTSTTPSSGSSPTSSSTYTVAKFCANNLGNGCTQEYDLSQTTCFTLPVEASKFITFTSQGPATDQNNNYTLIASTDATCGCQSAKQTVPNAVFGASQAMPLQVTGASYKWVAGTGGENTC